ncbi:MAG: Chitinase [Myxococcales bacterium]|nr:Chitinase [Myxococcales bacterium]
MRMLGIVALLAACNGFEAPAQPAGGAHPISNAGTGSSYPLGATVTLDGSRSFDPDGTILAYRWSILQRPTGSTAVPLDANAAATTFAPDHVGTYRLRLLVSDDAHNTDSSDLRIVSTGAITSVDAGPEATVSWLGTAHLSGSVTTMPGMVATYSWDFVSRPLGSLASVDNSNTLTPSFVADAAGTYIIALHARVGDEVRDDTVTIEATPSGVPLGAGVVAYTYSKNIDHIVYVHDVGHAEVVRVDPVTAAQATLDLGAFTPRSISVDPTGQVVAVGGLGKVASVAVSQFVLMSLKDVPGCTAAHVTIPYSTRVDCFPADGTTEPISSVDMNTGAVTQIPCPVRFPDVTLGASNWMYMVDGASSQFYLYDAFSTPPLAVIQHGSFTGIAPPVIAAGTNQPFAVTGNGLAVNVDATVRFDLHTPVSAGAFSALGYEIAVVSGAQLKVFGVEAGQPLKLTVTLPPVNGMTPTAKLVAYSADEHHLIIVAGTAAGDVAYTVPR